MLLHRSVLYDHLQACEHTRFIKKHKPSHNLKSADLSRLLTGYTLPERYALFFFTKDKNKIVGVCRHL